MHKIILISFILTSLLIELAHSTPLEKCRQSYERKLTTKITSICTSEYKNGSIEAAYYLGLIYQNGDGEPKDENKAFEWYQKAAKSGHAKSQHKLSAMYITGRAVNKNITSAIYWLNKAANKNNLQSQINLAFIYFKGEMVPADYNLSYYWSSIAVLQNDDIAKKMKKLSKYKLSDNEINNINNKVTIFIASAGKQ